MVTSGSRRCARTRLPSRTRRLPVRPAIGARMVAYCRLSRAWSTAAWLPASVAVAAAAWSAPARTAGVTYSFSASASYRLASCSAFAAWARSRARMPRPGQRRPVGPRIQLEEHLPLLDLVTFPEGDPHDRPLTCACTATVWIGSTVPVAASSNGTARRSAVATVTGTGGGGGGPSRAGETTRARASRAPSERRENESSRRARVVVSGREAKGAAAWDRARLRRGPAGPARYSRPAGRPPAGPGPGEGALRRQQVEHACPRRPCSGPVPPRSTAGRWR